MDKPILFVDFVDFWPSLKKTDNYIYHLLSRIYEIHISSNPDVLFYSCYGKKHVAYNCLKILYCAENRRPDFSGCDYALTFDFINDNRHFRWPLYAHHIDFENAWDKLTAIRTKEDAAAILKAKTKFCCMIVSNGNAKGRITFFHELSKHKQVDSGGKFLNNIGGPVESKMQFIKDYKFVFAFENAAYPGYTTEKIIQPLIVNSIPIYWGNPSINLDFNPMAFINANTKNTDELIETIMSLDSDDKAYMEMLMQPAFNNNQIPTYANEENVLNFLQNAINSRKSVELVSQQRYKRNLHNYNLKLFSLKKKIRGVFN